MSNLQLYIVNDSASYAARRAIALRLLGHPLSVHAAALRSIVRDAAQIERRTFGATFSPADLREACTLVAESDRCAWVDDLVRCESVTITGRRWFQRTYGNTYNTARILCDGFAFDLPKGYGYGDYWAQRCREWLKGVGYKGEIVQGGVSDVLRERDL
jgi:hypothetical protein